MTSAVRRLKTRSVRRILLGGGLLVGLAALAGCQACGRSARGPLEVPAGTPVVLISIDTLRADHLPAYGYGGVATPAIDALRKDAVLFQHAYSHTPLTLPSHTALLTGVLPAVSGVRDNVGYALDTAKVKSGAVPYLPSLLHAHGYATGAAVSAYVLRSATGLAQGFDLYEDAIEFKSRTGLGGLQRPGAETLAAGLPWLRGAAAKPLFFFLHLYEPHAPYEPPEPFASRYANKYDGEIATADAIVGDLIAELRKLDLYDRALVVLLGDHGEGLGDHGEDEHGVLLYDEDIHVPLLLKLPRGQRAGTSIAAPAQLTDVAPTLAKLLGLPAAAAWKGTPLTDLDDGAAPRHIYSETFYGRLHFGWSELFSLTDGANHLIDGPDPELYDLGKDPHERDNLRDRERRRFNELRGEVARYDRSLAPPSAVDEETRKQMAALGYLGGGASTSGPLPDPKQHVGELLDLKTGFDAQHKNDWTRAIAAYRRLLAKNDRMSDAWEFLGHALEKVGDRDGALDAYTHALRITNGAGHVAIAASSLLFGMERYDEAADHARMAMSENPSFTHGMLAQIALRRGRLDEAENEARLATSDAKADARLGSLLALAEVLSAKKQWDAALALTNQAQQLYDQRKDKDPDLIAGLHFLRGKIYADQGDAAAAQSEFEREIAEHPDDTRAYTHLALLFALTGRPQDAVGALKRMVDTQGSPAAYVEAVKALRVLKDPRGAASLLAFALQKFPQSGELQRLAKAG
jgi:arylsulfatase A-like enzyme/tetratricopeptide (TPR) repeat protein